MEVAWQESANPEAGQLKNWTESGQSTSGTHQPIPMACPPVSHAEKETILGISIAGILRLGGTWPPDGTKTIPASNVPVVTSSIKDANLYSEEDLMQRSQARLKEYMSSAKDRPPSAPTTYCDWPPNSKSRTPVWSVQLTNALSEQDIQRVNTLRPLRLAALVEGKKHAYRMYSNELYALTGKQGYKA